MSRWGPAVGMLLAATLPAQSAAELLADLDAELASRRQAAAAIMARRPSGDWVRELIRGASDLRPEGRRLAALALGRNREALSALAEACLGSPAEAELSHAALREHYREHALPAPPSPDEVAVLPGEPFELAGVAHLLDLIDRVQAGGRCALPIIVDPRLERPDSPAREPLQRPEGAWALRELLPLPDATGRAPIATRVTAQGLLVEAPGGPAGFAEAFAAAVRLVVDPASPPAEARRAAINLGSMDVPTIPRWLAGLARETGEPARRGRVALAICEIRGGDLDEGTAAVLREALSGDPENRVFLGCALRIPLGRALAAGQVPEWFRATDGGPGWRDPELAAVLAGVSPGPLREELESFVGAAGAGSELVVPILHALARAEGVLPDSTREQLCRRAFAGSDADDDQGNRALGAVLRVLTRRGGAWLERGPARLEAAVLGQSRERGRLWGLALGAAGEAGVRVALRTLAEATEVRDAHCGLLVFAEARGPEGAGLGYGRWVEARQAVDPATCPAASFLLDLAVGHMPELPRLTLAQKHTWLDAFRRLEQAAAHLAEGGEGSAAVQEALGRALGAVLLTFEIRVDDRSAAGWLVHWLGNQRLRGLFLAAAARCIRERPLVARDITFQLDRRREELAGKAWTLVYRSLDQLVRAKPTAWGVAPMDPADPLLPSGRSPR